MDERCARVVFRGEKVTPKAISKPGQTGEPELSTRDLLVEAAIDCLAEHGFAGTTMRLVADRAGVTQGPRQYYFPSPVDLYAAVVERIHSGQNRFVSGATKGISSKGVEELLRAIMVPAFKDCGSQRHLAMIELKLACRGHRDLQEAIGETIERFENDVDIDWVKLLQSSGLADQELIWLRSILSSTLRGLAISIAAGSDGPDRLEVCEELIRLFICRMNTAGMQRQS